VKTPARTRVPPGESVPVSVSYTPDNHAGIQRSHVLVCFNDPARPQMVLELRSRVRYPRTVRSSED
jgi:hypothetical protein